MSENQGKFGKNNQVSLGQGSFRGLQRNGLGEAWNCPNCDTVNMEEICFLCGYKKETLPVKKVGKKRIAIILAAILVLVSGLLLAFPNGWKEVDGNYYYYNWGRKTTGKMEIDGDWYFFNEEGVMHTGFREESGRDYYYGTDGRMVTGYREINGVEYYFSDNGAERVLKNVVTSNIAVGANRPEYVEFQLDNGNKTWDTVRVLLTPVDQCTYIHVNLEITKIEHGNADGKWQLSVRVGSDKKEWIHLSEFEVNEGKGECIVTLTEPISLEAFACTRIENDSWSGQMKYKLSEIRYIE